MSTSLISSIAAAAVLAIVLRKAIVLTFITHLRAFAHTRRGDNWRPLEALERNQLELARVNASKYGMLGSVIGLMFMTSSFEDPASLLSGFGMMLSTTLLGNLIDTFATRACWLDENLPLPASEATESLPLQTRAPSRLSRVIKSMIVIVGLLLLALLSIMAVQSQSSSPQAPPPKVAWVTYTENPDNNAQPPDRNDEEGENPEPSGSQLEEEHEDEESPKVTSLSPEPLARQTDKAANEVGQKKEAEVTLTPPEADKAKHRDKYEKQATKRSPPPEEMKRARPKKEEEKHGEALSRKGQNKIELKRAATLNLEGVTPRLQVYLTDSALRALSKAYCDIESRTSGLPRTYRVEEGDALKLEVEANMDGVRRNYSRFVIKERVSDRIVSVLKERAASPTSISCRRFLPGTLIQRLGEEAREIQKENSSKLLSFDVDHERGEWLLALREAVSATPDRPGKEDSKPGN